MYSYTTLWESRKLSDTSPSVGREGARRPRGKEPNIYIIAIYIYIYIYIYICRAGTAEGQFHVQVVVAPGWL